MGAMPRSPSKPQRGGWGWWGVEYLPAAAGAVLVLVFFHALLLWGDGLTSNINAVSSGALPIGALSGLVNGTASQELLLALEAAAKSARSRPLLGLPLRPLRPRNGDGNGEGSFSVAAGGSLSGNPAAEDREAAKAEEPTAEQPKAEQPKIEEPKPEQPKVEEPKQEEPKAEQPKTEEPKAEEPKTEQPKTEEPKPEEPKAEQPKPEEPKPEEPKTEEPKAEQPKTEEPKAEQPKTEQPKAEQPKTEEPKPEEPKAAEQHSSEILPPGHEGDLAEVAKLKALMAPMARDNTVVVTPANAGFLDMALNLMCRLRALGWEDTLFWALDQESADRFEKEGVPHYYDPGLFSISNAKGYHDPDYIRMMSERPRVWWRLLATGYDVLFLDADVVAFDRPDTYFERTADLEGQVDGWGWEFEKGKSNASNLCAGAFWIKSSPKSLDFMQRAFASFTQQKGKVERWDDQLALNWVFHDWGYASVITAGAPQGQRYRTDVDPSRFTVAFSEPERILPGHLFWQTQRQGSGYDVTFSIKVHENDTAVEFRPSLFHLNGHGKKAEKVQRLKDNGWWELDEELKCRGK